MDGQVRSINWGVQHGERANMSRSSHEDRSLPRAGSELFDGKRELMTSMEAETTRAEG